ncbi:hypothetical protein F443_19588 [Phytophthora nicotianae P1569]|uniref:RxLR effector protein n=1 Tax=Phytophthora nicotianae P1569 TaxID=1317065 RepID=V9E646_PHYNI|nr:hypothetical protein F443_19588 [Phytophthora nicotianae P1569]
MVMSPEWDQATQCSGPVRNTSWPLDRGTRDRGTSSPMEENSPTAALQVGCRGLSVAALASASGASATDLFKTASIKFEHSPVAAQANINVHRRLRKHDSQLDRRAISEERANIGTLLSENMAKLKAFLNKVDEMDEKAAQMIKGKTVEEAEQVLNKLTDESLRLFQGMEKQGITPQNLAKHPTFKELSKKEANYLTQYFDLYWKTFNGKTA